MDNNWACKVCGYSVYTEKSLNLHLKRHGLTKEEYYYQYYNRKDLLTGEPIEFKSAEQYLISDFNSKKNLNTYLNSLEKFKGQNYLLTKLQEYAKKKELKYAPSSVELRTIKQLPTINFFEKFFDGGYVEACFKINFKCLWKYDNWKSADLINLSLRTDTREQSPLQIPARHKNEVLKVNYGDYECLEPKCNIHIERKGLSDFLGTMSQGYERFEREIEGALKNKINLVILVEEDINDALGFDYLPHIYTKATPDFIFHRMRDLCRRFNNIQFVFVQGRKHSVKFMEQIFSNGDSAFKYDLQYIYEKELKTKWLG